MCIEGKRALEQNVETRDADYLKYCKMIVNF